MIFPLLSLDMVLLFVLQPFRSGSFFMDPICIIRSPRYTNFYSLLPSLTTHLGCRRWCVMSVEVNDPWSGNCHFMIFAYVIYAIRLTNAVYYMSCQINLIKLLRAAEYEQVFFISSNVEGVVFIICLTSALFCEAISKSSPYG